MCAMVHYNNNYSSFSIIIFIAGEETDTNMVRKDQPAEHERACEVLFNKAVMHRAN